jgi:hypothetical protein
MSAPGPVPHRTVRTASDGGPRRARRAGLVAVACLAGAVPAAAATSITAAPASAAAPACATSGKNNNGRWAVTIYARTKITCQGAKRIAQRCASSYNTLDGWSHGTVRNRPRDFRLEDMSSPRGLTIRVTRGKPVCVANLGDW